MKQLCGLFDDERDNTPLFDMHERANVVDAEHFPNIGDGTTIWAFASVHMDAAIGRGCTIGEGVHIGPRVVVGNGCKIQNGAQLFEGVTLEDDVFIGPHVVFTNVLTPRAFVNRRSEFKPTLVKKGASIGANATILCGITIGEYAMIGAGSVVTKDVLAYTLVVGNPAAHVGMVCHCGARVYLGSRRNTDTVTLVPCKTCNIGLRLTFSPLYPYSLNRVEPLDAKTT